MILIEKHEVYGWKAAIRGMRNPKESWHLSDSYFPVGETPILGPHDQDLAIRLATAGNDHGKYLRMIHVSVDITAPTFWWAEMDTFKVATVRDSCSLMHKGIKHYSLDDFSFEDLCPELAEKVVDTVNGLVDKYQSNPSEENFRALREFIPMSYNYKSTWDANYAVLRAIYHSRKTHRLKEWRDFCGWIETLPYSEFITSK